MHFQNSLKTGSGKNLLAIIPNTYFVVGTGNKTIKSVRFAGYDSLSTITSIIDDLSYDGNGDGTVPYKSATIMGGISVNSNNVKEVQADHTGILNDSEALKWTVRILTSN